MDRSDKGFILLKSNLQKAPIGAFCITSDLYFS